MVCPITNTDRNLPFHVKLDENLKTTGVVLCDQAKICDVQTRNYAFIEKSPKHILREATKIISEFIEIID